MLDFWTQTTALHFWLLHADRSYEVVVALRNLPDASLCSTEETSWAGGTGLPGLTAAGEQLGLPTEIHVAGVRVAVQGCERSPLNKKDLFKCSDQTHLMKGTQECVDVFLLWSARNWRGKGASL